VDTGGEARQRLFVAVPVPAGLLEFVRRAQGLLPRTPGLRLLGPAQLHVTLAFIGEVGARKADAARTVVETVPRDMGGGACVTGFLLLPSERRARVIALAIADEERVFGRLYEHVAAGLEAAGVMEREKRPFRPHLTVARLRNPTAVQPTVESGRAGFAVESVCLYESVLKREGAQYEVLTRTVLA